MKALIFGANGQDGYYLSSLCSAEGIEPVGVSRSGEGLRGDVACFSQVEGLIKAYQPDFIFHLAANSTTNHKALFDNHQAIATGTLNILESVYKWCPQARVFITGSGVQFKNEGKAIDENTPFEACNPYAVARIQSVYAARYFRSLGVRTFIGYLFHHESPFRKPHHLSKKIAMTAQRIAKGSQERIELGDMDVEKEYTFAGDVVEAILMLVRQDQIFEAVIGSGKAYSVKQWLSQCFSLVGLDWRHHVTLKDGYQPEYSSLVSNPATIRRLGWMPRVEIHALAEMMMGTSSLEPS